MRPISHFAVFVWIINKRPMPHLIRRKLLHVPPLAQRQRLEGDHVVLVSRALHVAVGCTRESNTRSTNIMDDGVAEEERAVSLAYLNSSASVRGAYGLKSTLWKQERSRMRSTSNVSAAQQAVP